MNKGIWVGLVAIAFVAGSITTGTIAYAESNAQGQPFQQLQQQIDDLVIGISGSGNSENVIKAIQFANEKEAKTICLLGGDGGKLANISQLCLIIPNNDMLTIETMHLLVCHLLTALLRSEGKPLFSY